MSFSYDPELNDSVSVVRLLIGDTTAPGKVTDEAITWALNENGGDVWLAASLMADTLASEYAALSANSISIGELSISNANLAESYTLLAIRLRENRLRGAKPVAFGFSNAEAFTARQDTDLPPIVSDKGGMDYPGVSERI